MKFSVFTLAFPGFNAENAVSASAKIGFDGVDIRTREDGHIYIDAKKQYRRQLLELAKSLNISFFGIYSYLGTGMASPENTFASDEIEKLEAHIDLAIDLEATHVRIFDGGRDRTEDSMKRFIERCRIACHTAADKGILIGIETHGTLAWDGDCCKRIIEEVGSENLKIVFDFANMYHSGLDPVVEARKIRDNILSVQFKDFIISNNKMRLVLLGKGQVPISKTINYLKEINFDGYVVDEYEKWWHPDLPDPLTGLQHDLEYLRRAFDSLD